MIFVDSGAFIAREIEKDAHHAAASAAWDRLERKPIPLLTSTLVVSEVLTYLRRHTRGRTAEGLAEAMLSSEILTILRPTADDDAHALRLFKKYRDQPTVSWADCVSFVLMTRRRIRRAFAFDGDFFDLAGFDRWPEE